MFARFARLVKYSEHYQKNAKFFAVPINKKTHYNFGVAKKIVMITPAAAAALWGTQEESSLTKKEVLLAKADALFDEGKYKEINELLENYKETGEVDILWRLARALYKMSETASEVEAKKLIVEGFEIIKKALEKEKNNFAVHKWAALLLDKRSEHVGMKERIKQLENVKKHMLQASDLNPDDATTLYMLGQWCFAVAELSWYQRKLASAFFATPPESSYEEALQFFQKAETTEPMFYSLNLLMLGKTYLKLKKMDEAKKYLKIASEYVAKTKEDQNAKLEAENLLSKI